jgi:hypothetical protein
MTRQVQERQFLLHPSEVQLLDTAIKTYLEYLQCVVLPSQERTQALTILRTFHLRLKSIPQEGLKAGQLWLADLEARAIEKALLIFCQRVPWLAGPSDAPDETLQALEKLRVRVSSLFSSPLNEK